MSEELAKYGDAERAEEITQRRGDAVERPRTTTIRNDLVAAWTELPNGALPPPDGGAA